MIPIDLSNKVAVITGGSGALGARDGKDFGRSGCGHCDLLLPGPRNGAPSAGRNYCQRRKGNRRASQMSRIRIR